MKVEVQESKIDYVTKSPLRKSLIYSRGFMTCSAIVAANSDIAFMAHALHSGYNWDQTCVNIGNVFERMRMRLKSHDVNLEDLTLSMHFGEVNAEKYLLNQAKKENLTVGYASFFRDEDNAIVTAPRFISYNLGRKEFSVRTAGRYQDTFRYP